MNLALVGSDRFADVDVHGRNRETLPVGHRLPRLRSDRVADRPRNLGYAGEVGERAEHALVLLSIGRRDEVRILSARSAMLDRALQRPQGLRPLTVLTTIPEQEWA